MVITAGCLIQLLNKGLLSILHFSLIVFDECHHATNNHKYCEILKKVEDCPELYRPRLVGLSASPIHISNLDPKSVANKITTLKKLFLDAIIYRPNLVSKMVMTVNDANSPIDFIAVPISNLQIQFNKVIADHLQVILREILSTMKVESECKEAYNKAAYNCHDRNEWNTCAQIISKAGKEDRTEVESSSFLLIGLGINFLLGPHFLNENVLKLIELDNTTSNFYYLLLLIIVCIIYLFTY